MNRIQSWLDDIQRLPGFDSSAWSAFRHRHSTTILPAARLDAGLAALGAVSGWLVEPSAVRELRDQVITLRQRPLSGEFFRTDNDGGGQFWQLGHRPHEGWSLDSHTLEPCTPTQANCLCEPAHHLHAGRPGARLAYWRLWHPDADGAPACHTALLRDIQDANR